MADWSFRFPSTGLHKLIIIIKKNIIEIIVTLSVSSKDDEWKGLVHLTS